MIAPNSYASELGFTSVLNHHGVSKDSQRAWYVVGPRRIKLNQECLADFKRTHLQMLTSIGSKITLGAGMLFIFAAFWMISSASLNLLWDINHRGDSGINLE